MSYGVKVLAGLFGTVLFLIFVGELSRSISSGFAGFWGGFPFMLIAILVGLMAIYDFWEECVRRSKR